MAVSRSAVRFGANENQLRHTFRHTDRFGLAREAVVTAISEDLAGRRPMLPGSYISGSVIVGGIMLEYRAFLLSDGTINIGCITGV